MILKQNRIHSIHFSLAFEVNSLSLDEIRSVIGGKTMIGPQKEFQEVKNTYQAYDLPGKFDPFSLAEFNRLYSRMIYLEVQESGVFHSHNKGVFNGDTCIFMALPPQFMPEQMEALLAWMCRECDIIHPPILSSVFHYEFVFIHPFKDGNGRIA